MQNNRLPEPDLYRLTIPGEMLERGFWLYVWDIYIDDKRMLYVGRTGDESSANAAAPYNRFGQHLNTDSKANALRRNLQKAGYELADVLRYNFHFYGPIFAEANDFEKHKPLRDCVAALEKKLADSLTSTGYTVLNKVYCRRDINKQEWQKVKGRFAEIYPELLP